MNNLINYSFNEGEECINLLNQLIYEYNQIYNETKESINLASGAWQGEAGDKFRNKSENFMHSMRMMQIELNSLYETLSSNHHKIRTLESRFFEISGGSGE